MQARSRHMHESGSQGVGHPSQWVLMAAWAMIRLPGADAVKYSYCVLLMSSCVVCS